VLVLDSGVGGLGVVAELRALRPGLPIVYLADTAGFPYGDRPADDLARHLVSLLGRAIALVSPSLVVVACNTASVAALATLRARFDVPFVGCVPAVKWAAALSRTRCFGLLATPATVSRPYVADLVARFASDCVVLSHGACSLAALAEARFHGAAPAAARVAAELDGLLGQAGAARIDTVVLGCTHYRLLLPELARAAPRGITWLDPAPAVARQAAFVLDTMASRGASRAAADVLAAAGEGSRRAFGAARHGGAAIGATAFVTAPPARPRDLARRLLAYGFGRLRLLEGDAVTGAGDPAAW
jgi:glutamate racemase